MNEKYERKYVSLKSIYLRFKKNVLNNDIFTF